MDWSVSGGKSPRRGLRRAVVAALGLAVCLGAARGAAAGPAASEICRDAIGRTELENHLPTGILQAIALAESGRWDDRTRSSFAWPWTVTARGEGTFHPTRAAAIAAVRELRRDGVRNIDVGCLQINLMYHPNAFRSLEQAFNPAANARYAARLFQRLRKANRSITRAIAHYHSRTRALHVPYTRKVVRLWNEERRRHFDAQRLRRIEEWHAERERRRQARNAAP